MEVWELTLFSEEPDDFEEVQYGTYATKKSAIKAALDMGYDPETTAIDANDNIYMDDYSVGDYQHSVISRVHVRD